MSLPQRTLIVFLSAVLSGLTARGQSVPPEVKQQFVQVAGSIKAFPPDRMYLGGEFVQPYRGDGSVFGQAKPIPGIAEYKKLLESDFPLPSLLSLLKDSDPKIRTLAASVIVNRGDPALFRYLLPLADDQSSTFESLEAPMTANYVPPSPHPQSVGTAILRLVNRGDAAQFKSYVSRHSDRDYYADWFWWQFQHGFEARARSRLKSVPSPDRELITLWIGVSRPGNSKPGFSEPELVDAAAVLGRENTLGVLRFTPPTADPDIRFIKGAYYDQNERYSIMVHFLLAHARQSLTAADADTLLAIGAGEGKDLWPEWWWIAAVNVAPEKSREILAAAERRWPDDGKVQLAKWDTEGRKSIPEILRWFNADPKRHSRLSSAIYDDMNERYRPLVEAILTSR